MHALRRSRAGGASPACAAARRCPWMLRTKWVRDVGLQEAYQQRWLAKQPRTHLTHLSCPNSEALHNTALLHKHALLFPPPSLRR